MYVEIEVAHVLPLQPRKLLSGVRPKRNVEWILRSVQPERVIPDEGLPLMICLKQVYHTSISCTIQAVKWLLWMLFHPS